MTALDASAVGKITVKSPAVEDTVELKANIAIALLLAEVLYMIAPPADIVKLENTSSAKSTNAVVPDNVIEAESSSCPPAL
tara:strand:+ start:353 stop:595 length:243 start_codon:yes stop_codon:yes gene_type:complete